MRREKRNLAITEILMIIGAAIWFIPIYYLIVTTLKTPQEATYSPLALPKDFQFGNYIDAWVKWSSRELSEIHFLLRFVPYFSSLFSVPWQAMR